MHFCSAFFLSCLPFGSTNAMEPSKFHYYYHYYSLNSGKPLEEPQKPVSSLVHAFEERSRSETPEREFVTPERELLRQDSLKLAEEKKATVLIKRYESGEFIPEDQDKDDQVQVARTPPVDEVAASPEAEPEEPWTAIDDQPHLL